MANPGVVVGIPSRCCDVDEVWAPRMVAEFHGPRVKLARGEGQFGCHTHDDIDDLLWIHCGSVGIQMRDRPAVRPAAGDLLVVPAGVEHRLAVEDECGLCSSSLPTNPTPETWPRPRRKSGSSERSCPQVDR